jgi:hypothetical protein
MNKIPHNSQVSLLKGYWFIFQDGDREIAAHASALSGRERVFVNGRLVSRKRSLTLTSNHQFLWEGSTYIIVFHAPRLLAAQLECSLTKDNVFIDRFKTSYKLKHRALKVVCSALVGALLGFCTAYFYLPLWPLIIFGVFFMALIVDRETRNIVINREVRGN